MNHASKMSLTPSKNDTKVIHYENLHFSLANGVYTIPAPRGSENCFF
jgi:hypothetical protein